MAEVLKTLGSLLARVGLREPWKMTGVRSLPDFEHYLPDFQTSPYRKFSPGNQPVKAIIPRDPPKLIYDIKYYVRDYRRNNKYTARTVEAKTPFDFEKMYASAPLKPEEVKNVPRPDVMPTRGY